VNVYRISEQYLLTGSQSEYYLYDRKKKQYTLYLDGTNTGVSQPYFIFQFYDPSSRHFYFSNFYGGLFCLDEKGKLLHNWKQDNTDTGLTNSNISFMKKMNDSIFWLGTIGGGLHILNRKNNRIDKFTRDKDDPGSLAGDNVVAC